jgi:hypothetical protein
VEPGDGVGCVEPGNDLKVTARILPGDLFRLAILN